MTPEEEEKAIEDAHRLLVPIKISSWNEAPKDPKEELARVIALVECAFGELADTIPEPVRKRAIEFLKQCRPPIRKRGSYSLAGRDRVIVEAIAFIKDKYRIDATQSPASDDLCACSIVAEALSRLGIDLTEKAVANIWGARTIPE